MVDFKNEVMIESNNNTDRVSIDSPLKSTIIATSIIKAYVTNLKKIIEGTVHANQSLDDIIRSSEGGVFNNAAQIWNHTFYWNSLTPSSSAPTGDLASAIDAAFGSFADFQAKFTASAAGNFGSGWTWLVKNAYGALEIVNTGNAGTPITNAGITPLLTVDV